MVAETHQPQNPHSPLGSRCLLSLTLGLHLAHLLSMCLLLALHDGISLLLHGHLLLLRLLLLLRIGLLGLLRSLLRLRLTRLTLRLLRVRLWLIWLLALLVRIFYPRWWSYLLWVCWLPLRILRILWPRRSLIALLGIGMLHSKLLCHMVLLLLLLCVLLLGHLLLLSTLELHLLLHQVCRELDLSAALHLALLLEVLHLCGCQLDTLWDALHLRLLLRKHLLMAQTHLLVLHC